MKLKYNLTIDELMDFFCDKMSGGFSEQELSEAEQELGIKIPLAFRRFLLKYGKYEIKAAFDNIFSTPKEFITTYKMIDEILEDLENDFREAVQNGTQDEYAENEYFSLWKLPKEEWHTVTQNYLLVGCDSEGIAYTGYLIEDIIDGNEDAPVYMSCDDEIIEFRKWTDNTEHFIIEMICETAWENNNCDYYDPSERVSIEDIFEHFSVNIDAGQLKMLGHVGTCIDTDAERLYVYFDYGNFQRLFYVDR